MISSEKTISALSAKVLHLLFPQPPNNTQNLAMKLKNGPLPTVSTMIKHTILRLTTQSTISHYQNFSLFSAFQSSSKREYSTPRGEKPETTPLAGWAKSTHFVLGLDDPVNQTVTRSQFQDPNTVNTARYSMNLQDSV
jgi:hypothetical protein